MRVIIGTYRQKTHIPTALTSIDKHLKNVSDIVFIDDSGDPDNAAWLAQYGRVVETGGRGYNVAMKALCQAAEGQQAYVHEEDFSLLEDVDLDHLSEILYHRPYLAQVALLRSAHFPVEHEHGGLIEALEAKGHQFDMVHGILENSATFTCNPSVWRGEVFAAGWPDGKWSEDRKRDVLLRQGYRFGFVPGVKVAHDGVRSGKGY